MAEAGFNSTSPYLSDILSIVDKPTNLTPECLSGAETAELVAEIYDIAGRRMGPILMEANILLTLSGARGQTEASIISPIAEDWEAVTKVNEKLQPKGVSITARAELSKTVHEKDVLTFDVESLLGYAHVSHLAKAAGIPGVEPFDASKGWEGLVEWKQDTWNAIETALKTGQIPYPPDQLPHIFYGIIKGYPKRAIFDICDWLLTEGRYRYAVTDIPYVALYGGAQPNFGYHSDHAHDASIRNTVAQWGNILKEFYAHPWHQKISQDAQFIHTRGAREHREI